MAFINGQRYINNADLQLGLGRVVGENQRMVKVAFDAVGEERIYAKDSAPLGRFEPQVDDVLQHKDGWQLTIKEVKNLNGLYIYFGVKSDGEEDVIPETEITDTISLDRPADRLLNAQIDKQKWYQLRQQARAHQQRLHQSDLFGLCGCRTALLPHQLYIAHAVGQRHAPRVLLADEVGLGKTIEACLILHQQLLTNRARRALIVVPESLTHQWMIELLRRFNLQVSVFDEEKCVEIESSSGLDNPFDSAQFVLLPLEMLLNNPVRSEQILATSWDLLIVDEAHHLQWTENTDAVDESLDSAVQAYHLIEAFSEHIPGVLLLTATPEQLGRRSHFARLRLLDPHKYTDYDTFLAEESKFEQVADAIESIIDAVNQGQSLDVNDLKTSVGDALSADLMAQIHDLNKNPENGPVVINQLLDQHGTGRVLFRNTRQSVSGFPARECHATALPLPVIYTDVADASLCPERSEEAAENWLEEDPRVNWLVEQFKSLYGEKLLVIASQAETVLQLEQMFREKHGVHVAVFHEGMSLIERDQAAAWFADHDNGAPILLCSEIGSEGRNFQFAHHLLFFDLPGHPDLLEQRIGRLDRIGQTETIHIHVPYLEDSVQAHWFHWYDQGLNLFNATNPAAGQVFARYGDRLNTISDEKALGDLIADSQHMSQTLLAQMHRGRDRLLEYNSCRPGIATALKTRAAEFEQAESLQKFMHRVFDLFGVHCEDHREGSEIIRPTDEMHGYFPYLLEEGMTITYERDIALANEHFHYLTWEHPMVTELLELILTQEQGNVTMAVLQGAGLNPGQIFLECRYQVQAAGGCHLQLSRYLPPMSQRYVMAEMGVDVASKLTTSVIDRFRAPVPKNIAVEVLKAKLSVVKSLLSKVDELMVSGLPEIKQQALSQAEQQLSQELNRLQALAQNNGQVRDDEFEFLKSTLAQVKQAIEQTTPQLDSIRILVTA